MIDLRRERGQLWKRLRLFGLHERSTLFSVRVHIFVARNGILEFSALLLLYSRYRFHMQLSCRFV